MFLLAESFVIEPGIIFDFVSVTVTVLKFYWHMENKLVSHCLNIILIYLFVVMLKTIVFFFSSRPSISVQNEIEDRKNFLKEMEVLGQGEKYRTIIATEISQVSPYRFSMTK